MNNDNKTGIMQPYFFPYIGYWQLMNAVDTFVVLDDVNFIMRGWINRNNILLNNKAYLFSIPLDKPSQNKLIKDTKLNFSIKDRENFLKTIQLAYKKAPFYDDFYPILENIIMFNDNTLVNFIYNSLVKASDYIGIKTKFVFSSKIEQNNESKAEAKIIDICKSTATSTYINAIGGISLYNKNNFEKNGIQLNFIQTKEIEYKQFNTEFVPNLSMLDVIMFNSVDQIKMMLERYELV